MPRPEDTIAALATPVGTAALAVLRISGSDTKRIAAALVARPLAPRVATHVDYRSRDGQLLDDVMFTLFQAPRSYTGEDSLEICCHGNPFIAQRILEDLLARGCRPAEPGEFTQRAFLNGRMDLSQAEAVMDVIHARSERALAAAHAQLRGSLGRRMEALVEALLQVLARIEAYIDFPDEDLPPEDRKAVARDIDRIIFSCNELSATSHHGDLLREGIKTIILGAPNAGKSSLLNALVGRDRALVSAEPGTTRDFIEEVISVGPHALRLIDTAGLNTAPAPLERLGMEKSLEQAEEADLVLWVLDVSMPSVAPLPSAVAQRLTADNTLIVFNKTDLPVVTNVAALPVGPRQLRVSARTGAGLPELRDAIVGLADRTTGASAGTEMVAINARHSAALTTARDALAAGLEKLHAAEPVELVSSDLRAALAAFGEITGRIDNERMLDQLFATFCIGK